MGDTTEDIPEDLNCPICFEIPLDKVFQCEEGHTLCEQCYSKLKNCPQCKIPFGARPIRSRLAEKMLENYRCPFRTLGCTAIISRMSREEHMEACMYNESEFGALLNICENFGVSKCPFKMNKLNTEEAFTHLQTEHQVFVKDTELKLRLPEFSKMLQNSKENGWTFTSQPIILKGEFAVVVKLVIAYNHDGTYSLYFASAAFPDYNPRIENRLYCFEYFNLRVAIQQNNEYQWSVIPVSRAVKEMSQFVRKLAVVVEENEAPLSLIIVMAIVLPNESYSMSTQLENPVDLPVSAFTFSTDAVTKAKTESEADVKAIKYLMENDAKLYQQRIKALEDEIKKDKEEIKSLNNRLNVKQVAQISRFGDTLSNSRLAGIQAKILLCGTYKHDGTCDIINNYNAGRGYRHWFLSYYDGETISWKISDELWTQTSITPGKKHLISFKLGEKFEEMTPFGQRSKSVIKIIDKKFVHTLNIYGWFDPVIKLIREFNESNNQMILTVEHGPILATRIYKEIK